MVDGKRKPVYWNKAKTKLMKEPKKFLLRLKNFGKHEKTNIPKKAISKFTKEIIPAPDFN